MNDHGDLRRVVLDEHCLPGRVYGVFSDDVMILVNCKWAEEMISSFFSIGFCHISEREVWNGKKRECNSSQC